MTNHDVINFLNQVRKILLDDKAWLESTIQPINEAFDVAISALQAQDSSVDLFPDLTIVEKAEIRGYVKGQLDAINDLVAAGLIEREKAISVLKDHDLDEAGKDTISRQAAIDTDGLDEEIRCEMCKNPMHTDRGCDGHCTYDEKLYERIIQILNKRIKPLSSVQPEMVKCKKCRYVYYDKEFGNYWCDRMSDSFKVEADGYCKWGK